MWPGFGAVLLKCGCTFASPGIPLSAASDPGMRAGDHMSQKTQEPMMPPWASPWKLMQRLMSGILTVVPGPRWAWGRGSCELGREQRGAHSTEKLRGTESSVTRWKCESVKIRREQRSGFFRAFPHSFTFYVRCPALCQAPGNKDTETRASPALPSGSLHLRSPLLIDKEAGSMSTEISSTSDIWWLKGSKDGGLAGGHWAATGAFCTERVGDTAFSLPAGDTCL
ncbi:uncharacterized protein LOC121492993 isoform X2 [Vulpes lagopus]|uniref:uncharacterized protein LOC121492993 isoform X2 n=1 Tax=Vulpes lagopus TaxID=494514 RepID=UPI001BCA5984|nr:uncharacterized protein LOC121492993 isoform X2 [Vulpes lagopus]